MAVPTFPMRRRRAAPRTAEAAPGKSTTPCVVAPEHPAPIAGAMVIVILVLVLASVLQMAGDTVEVILGLLTGACYIGTEAVRRLTTAE